MKHTLKILFIGTLLLFIACTREEKLIISGTITGAKSDTISIKHLQNNKLTSIERQALNNKGQFKFSLKKKTYPEYYFLQINDGAQLVIIRDSSNNINISADAKTLNKAKIKGSKLSEQIQKTSLMVSDLRADYKKFQSDYNNADNITKTNMTNEISDRILKVKKNIGEEIFKSPRSYYSYFALFQRLDKNNVLFSPYEKDDYKYFATTATAYNIYQKDDPRTKALYNIVNKAIEDQRAAALQKMIDESPNSTPDIIMNDTDGIEHKLSDNKGKIVILNFWSSTSEESRNFNKSLLSLYNKYKDRDITVFQVSADKSKIFWEQAINEDKLRWVNVCDFNAGASKAFVNYNVQNLPTTFIIDKNGELNSRHNNITDLEKAIIKLL